MAIKLSPLVGRHKAAATIIAIAALLLAAGAAQAATAPIYKCVGKDHGLVYTDQPCKGGEMLDVHPGDVDPAAVERLQVARDMLDRSAAARIANEQRIAEQAAFAAMMQRQRDSERVATEADYDSYPSPDDQYLTWYPGTGRTPRPHPPHKPPPTRPTPHGSAPRGPFVGPRS